MKIIMSTEEGLIEEVKEAQDEMMSDIALEVEALNMMCAGMAGKICHTVKSEKARLILLSKMYDCMKKMIIRGVTEVE